MEKRIRIYGERGTGTNYLSRLLEKNLNEVEVINNGNFWKHGPPQDELVDTNIIVISRHPYRWLYSLYKTPHHMDYMREKSFSEFLRTEAQDYAPEGQEPRRYENPMVMWNAKYKAWLSADKKHNVTKAVKIRYEALCKYPEVTVEAVAQKFGLETTDKISDIRTRVNDRGNITGRTIDKRRKSRVMPPGSISDEDLQYIDSQLDANLVMKYGYKLRSFEQVKEKV